MQTWVDRNPFVFILIVFPTIWIAACMVIGQVGGWAALAQQFEFREDFTGQRWRLQSARMRLWVRYGNCLTVGANPDGLYVAILFLFRVGHPPLFIPWREVSIAKKGGFLLIRYVELRLGHDLLIPFRINESLANRLRDAAGKGWPPEPWG